MINNSPADEYLRFAILSFFQNNSNEIGKEEIVKVKMQEKTKTITVNGIQIQKFMINNEDLADINFETDSQDLMVSYYYQTMLEEVSNNNVIKDIKINLNGDMKVGNTLNLKIDFNGVYEGTVRIALPNALRLSQKQTDIDENSKYYIQNNRINYITIYKTKNCKSINLPVIVINQGNYKFENIVCNVEGKYHISNSLNLNFK